jgi:predicted ATPase
MWGVIFGDNGVGKTTVLRCIAMGLCDQASAAGLLREIYGEWNREVKGELQTGEIRLDFHTEDGKEAWIRTDIIPATSGYSQIKRKSSPKDFPWERIFACGYGSARRAFGSRDVEDYATIESVYTLFNYDTPLQNPELVIRRILGVPEDRKRAGKTKRAVRWAPKMGPLLDSLAEVLMLPPGSVRLTSGGLTISGPWGDFQAVGGLGDGFQATLAWITDLLGWAMLFKQNRPIQKVRGIVLIDELEQHLHPRWQRQIVKLLRDHFPLLQFIVTTHTPMCAIGTTDLKDDECELIKLERSEGAVRAVENIPPPRRQRADQVLTSFLFELPTSSDNSTVADIQRYNMLRSRKRLTAEQHRESRALRLKLADQLGAAETDFEERVRRAVLNALKEEDAKGLHLDAANFETLRQLREITNEKN